MKLLKTDRKKYRSDSTISYLGLMGLLLTVTC